MRKFLNSALLGTILSFTLAHSAWALDLDWSGQFRSDAHFIFNSSLGQGNTYDPIRAAQLGYYVPGSGSDNAMFTTLFMRLKPTVVVNDNVSIKSEWWVGNPATSFFGSAAPSSFDSRQYYSTQSSGSFITAQRVWAELVSDFGTIQVGRLPLNYGLGVVWNDGSQQWSRYLTTSDGARLIAKFGSFTVSPSALKYSTGNSIGGSCQLGTADGLGRTCFGNVGTGDTNEYSLMLQYENLEEDVEMGVNFIRRTSGSQQDVSTGYFGVSSLTASSQYNIYDIYAKKRVGKLTLGAEAPITQGTVGGANYRALSVAMEVDYKANEAWSTSLKLGRAGGQGNITSGATTPDTYSGFYFNPNYRLGLIMFNYAFQNFAGPNTQNNPAVSAANVASPFDNPITNANYLSWTGRYKLDKWSFNTAWTVATAVAAAKGDGGQFFNTWYRRFVQTSGTATNQSSFLGWEMDYGTGFKWDDNVELGLDLGMYFPGDYYRWNNDAGNNGLTSIFATNFRLSVGF